MQISKKGISIWLDTKALPKYQKLDHDVSTNLCIIGAGIAGLTTAYLFLKTGKKVLVLDDGEIASGETAFTTAHLSNEIDDNYFEIERLRGEKIARLAYESHTKAIDTIERIVNQENIDCNFERLPGHLFLGANDKKETLEKEVAAAKRAGHKDAMLETLVIDSKNFGPCITFPNQAQFHPLKYMSALAEFIIHHGGEIYTNTKVENVTDDDPAIIQTTAGYTITAQQVVVATNSPINERVVIHTKQAPYLTYVIGIKVPLHTIPRALYWDTEDPYHYVRLQTMFEGKKPVYDVLIVGGEDHKSGQEDDGAKRFDALFQWAKNHFPRVQDVVYTWSGQVMESYDGLAFIGRKAPNTPNTYIVTGDSGMGMTHGTIAGLLLTDLILGNENPWAKVYDPSRVPVKATAESVGENIHMAAQYIEWLSPGEVKSFSDIKPGEGAVMRRGIQKVAVYRDNTGELHQYSAVCTHLGCIVQFNSTQKTWDCPCHGSRYDSYGKVLNGPAAKDLKPLTE